MLEEGTLTRIIQDIRYAGMDALLQYDILDAIVLTEKVQNNPVFRYISRAKISKALRALEMRPLGLHTVYGRLCHVWTSAPEQPLAGIIHTLRKRYRTNASRLHMELVLYPIYEQPPREPLLTDLERDVLAIRIQRFHFQPFHSAKRIAAKLGISIEKVNRCLFYIRRKLKIESLKDTPALRRAIEKTGALMDDPAFW